MSRHHVDEAVGGAHQEELGEWGCLGNHTWTGKNICPQCGRRASYEIGPSKFKASDPRSERAKEYEIYCDRQRHFGNTPVPKEEFDLLHWLHSEARGEWLAREHVKSAIAYTREAIEIMKGVVADLPKNGKAPAMPSIRDAIFTAALSRDSKARKDTPIFSGVIRYFPLALAAVARLSKAGNDKYNPGEPLHWARKKSTDHGDCIVRHQIEFDQIDADSDEYHACAVAWRALAQLELLEEQRQKK